MRSRQRRWLLNFGMCAGLWACGGAEPGLDVSLSVQGLSAVPVGLRVAAFESVPPCPVVRLSDPWTPALVDAVFDLDDPDALYELPELPAGPYTVAVWALDDAGAPFGFGCVSDVRVNNGEATKVAIRLDDWPR